MSNNNKSNNYEDNDINNNNEDNDINNDNNNDRNNDDNNNINYQRVKIVIIIKNNSMKKTK